MKNIVFKITIMCALFFCRKTGFSQNRPNNVEMMNIEIAKPNKKGHIDMYSPMNELIKMFGKPLKTEEYYFEMDDKHGFVVKYQGANFYYQDNRLIGFDFDSTAKGFLIGLKDQRVFSGIGKSLNTFNKLKFVNGGAFFNVQSFGADAQQILSFQTDQKQLVTKIFFTSYNPLQEKELTVNP